MSKGRYTSDVELGEKYRDTQTGFVGVATSISFFQHACERIGLEAYDPERYEVKTEVFDAPRLEHVPTGKQASTTRPGGPHTPNAQRTPNARGAS